MNIIEYNSIQDFKCINDFFTKEQSYELFESIMTEIRSNNDNEISLIRVSFHNITNPTYIHEIHNHFNSDFFIKIKIT